MSWEDRIGRRLKLRDVHILLTVVQSGSMAKAAERLAVSQPVVSKTITDLEHTLGVRLLDRSRKGVEVTPYGRALLDRGVAAFDELRQGVKEIEFLSDPTAGEVRIAGTPPMVLGLLPVVIDRLRRQHPRLSFQVTETSSGPAFYDQLRQRAIDFIIGRLPIRKLEKDLNGEIVFGLDLCRGRNTEPMGQPTQDRTGRPDRRTLDIAASRYHSRRTCRRHVPRLRIGRSAGCRGYRLPPDDQCPVVDRKFSRPVASVDLPI